jgi:ketol-acid reductoisomerase
MAKLNFGGVEENVVTREEFPLSKAQEVLKDEIIAIIGYGVQGPAQALNLKDNGISVIIGHRHSISGIRCSPAGSLAQTEALSERRGCIVFLPRILHYLQGTDRRNTA